MWMLPIVRAGSVSGSGAGATSEDEPRYYSGSSSCGSEARRPNSGYRTRSSGQAGASYRTGADAGESRHSRRGAGGSNPIASPEMVNCAQSVLARIEEALTKLDGDVPGEGDSTGSGRRNAKGASRDIGRHGRQTTSRPQSARGTARTNPTPRAITPR